MGKKFFSIFNKIHIEKKEECIHCPNKDEEKLFDSAGFNDNGPKGKLYKVHCTKCGEVIKSKFFKTNKLFYK